MEIPEIACDVISVVGALLGVLLLVGTFFPIFNPKQYYGLYGPENPSVIWYVGGCFLFLVCVAVSKLITRLK